MSYLEDGPAPVAVDRVAGGPVGVEDGLEGLGAKEVLAALDSDAPLGKAIVAAVPGRAAPGDAVGADAGGRRRVHEVAGEEQVLAVCKVIWAVQRHCAQRQHAGDEAGEMIHVGLGFAARSQFPEHQQPTGALERMQQLGLEGIDGLRVWRLVAMARLTHATVLLLGGVRQQEALQQILVEAVAHRAKRHRF